MWLAEGLLKVIIFFRDDAGLRKIYFLLNQKISVKEQILVGVYREIEPDRAPCRAVSRDFATF